MAVQYIGEIKLVAFEFAPEGWALCNGQLLPIAQNDALYNLIGTTYGGDGQTTFALPNLQSRVPVHQGTGTGLSPYIMGQQTGVETVALTTSQIPSHNHAIGCNSAGGNAASPVNNVPATESTGTSLDYNTAANGSMSGAMVGSTGGGATHTNIQPVLCLNFIIALQGTYPSQG
jgi:microcystin-dependent protein